MVVEQPADLIGHVEQERLDGGVAVQDFFQRHPERRFQAGTLILASQGGEDRPGQGDEAQLEGRHVAEPDWAIVARPAGLPYSRQVSLVTRTRQGR